MKSMSTTKSLSSSDIIVLNVGGIEYTTSRATLIKYPESMLARMFSGTVPTAIDKKGRYFIDRDGKLFHYILQYLRTGFTIFPEDKLESEALTIEADFYMLDKLSSQIHEYHKTYSDDADIVTINVGGREFVTTRKTVTCYPNSLLGRIFKGYQHNELRLHKHHFFDRDPELFVHVLQFLRNERLYYSGTSKESRDFLHNLLCEARFFKLQELVSNCMSLLRYCDQD